MATILIIAWIGCGLFFAVATIRSAVIQFGPYGKLDRMEWILLTLAVIFGGPLWMVPYVAIAFYDRNTE